MTINLNTTTNNTNGFSYFSYLRKSTGELNYYVNDDFGMSIYNSNWSFIKHLNTTIPTNGQIIILNNYIYIFLVILQDILSCLMQVTLI